jgi:hypothetical protein
MRLHRRSLVAEGKPSAGSADRYSAPRSTYIIQSVRTHRRPIFLAIGALFLIILITGVALPTTVAFVSGLLFIALGAPNAGPHNPEAARVRTWQWLYKSRAEDAGTDHYR